jgi:hypothetical protein
MAYPYAFQRELKAAASMRKVSLAKYNKDYFKATGPSMQSSTLLVVECLALKCFTL